MPTLLHDPATHTAIRNRVQSLRADTQRRWGKMSIDQMLWHVNVSMREAVGEYTPDLKPLPIPKSIFRWAVLNIPWGRGAPTRPDMRAVSTYDFDAQKAACLSLIDRIAAKPLTAPWSASASMGTMKGKHWSQMTAKHLDHHLRQFGV